MPPVFPILKQPGLIPPTVAGPIIETPFCLAVWMSFLVMFSGIPSAMIAIVLIWNYFKNSQLKFKLLSKWEVPEDSSWFPWCSHTLNAERQSWQEHQHLCASSWHPPFSCKLQKIQILKIHTQMPFETLTVDENFLVAPVELLLVVTSERIDHSCHRRLAAPANKVKIQHALQKIP